MFPGTVCRTRNPQRDGSVVPGSGHTQSLMCGGRALAPERKEPSGRAGGLVSADVYRWVITLPRARRFFGVPRRRNWNLTSAAAVRKDLADPRAHGHSSRCRSVWQVRFLPNVDQMNLTAVPRRQLPGKRLLVSGHKYLSDRAATGGDTGEHVGDVAPHVGVEVLNGLVEPAKVRIRRQVSNK